MKATTILTTVLMTMFLFSGCLEPTPSDPGGGGEPRSCPDPSDPGVHYIDGSFEDPSICLAILFACDEGQEPFSDECGCGCIDVEPTCPDPDDPRVHYIADSHEDPTVCHVIDFGCDEGQELFSDECGCGCIDVEPTCAGLDEDACIDAEGCEPGYSGFCDCTCPGPAGYEGGGCDECAPECFTFAACVEA